MDADVMLADSAVNAEGKLYLQGAAWNVIRAQTLPIRVPRIGLGIVINVPWTATNQPHQLEVRLDDPDGQTLPLGDAPPGVESPDGKVRRLGAGFNVGRPALLQPGDDQVVPIAINIDGLFFDKADRYAFVVSIDGDDVKRLPVRVVLAVQPTPIMSP